MLTGVVRQAAGRRAETAWAFARQAQQLLDRGEFAGAHQLAVEAEREAGQLAEQEPVEQEPFERLLATSTALLAQTHYRLDRHLESMQIGTRAVRLWRELGDPAGESMARSTVCRVLILTGDMDQALQEGLEALELADLSAELRPRMIALTAVGIVHLCLRRHEQAMRYCERAAETARLLDDPVNHGNLLDTIACVHLSMAYAARADDDEEQALALAARAAELSREGWEILRRAGHRSYELNTLGNLAEALAFVGRPHEALRLLEGFPLDPQRDETSRVTQHLDSRGAISIALGRYEEAIELYTEALRLSVSDNNTMWYCEHISEAYEKTGDLRSALNFHRRFHALFKQVASADAQRSAGIAAIRLETEALQRSNLELSRRAELLLEQSQTDPLTGVANRRKLDRTLDDDLNDHAVLLLDVDHFKRVNDGYSHQVGDEVLRRIGLLLHGLCRPIDLAARYGGEEFVLLLRHVSDDEASGTAERVREVVQAFDWQQVADGLAITVSIGVACAHETPTCVELMELADRRLYEAKHAGRNAVIGPPAS